MKKILLLSSFTVLLGACGAQESIEKDNDKPDQEIEAATEAEETSSMKLINKPITKTFEPKVTDVSPPFTAEEQDLHDELNERINAETELQKTDREFMASIAGDYEDYSPEELAEFWNRGYDIIFYGVFGDQAIYHNDLMDLIDQVIDTNIVADASDKNFGVEWNGDLTMTKSEGTFVADGQRQKASIELEYSDDYEHAELVRFVVNGELVVE